MRTIKHTLAEWGMFIRDSHEMIHEQGVNILMCEWEEGVCDIANAKRALITPWNKVSCTYKAPALVSSCVTSSY